jgi:homopolymeric O-antigen transport system permease protein
MAVDDTHQVEGGTLGGGAAVQGDAHATRPARTWVENRPARSWWPRIDLAELWVARDVAVVLALRNIKSRYKQTFFGAAWAILQPLAGVAIFSIVLGRLARVPHDGIPYPVFVFAGLALWGYFAASAHAATDSLAGYRQLITKVYFPRLLAPIAAVIPPLLDFGVTLVVVAIFMVVFGVAPSYAIVFLPLWVLATILFSFGVGVWLAALNVKYRDVRNAIAFLLQVWFFATPIAYASSLLSGGWSVLIVLNPMAGLVDGFRWSLIGAPPPGGAAAASLAVGLVVVLGGFAYFARAERYFADVI